MKKVVIIGGGASGIVCAIKAKQNNPKLDILILEKNDRIGKKILKTGNGRCNISNLNMKSSFYNHPDFIEKCFSNFSIDDMLQFFNKIGLLIKDDGTTRLYPYSESATTVLEVFRYELERLNIDIKCNHQVLGIKKGDKFYIDTNQGNFEADIIVISTGSLAQERTNGYQLLESFHHNIMNLSPGLVPLKTKENLKSIQGIRVKCLATVLNNQKVEFQEDGEILFKEQGLSGVLTLNLSRYVKKSSIISLDLFPQYNQLKDVLNEILYQKNVEDGLMGILPKMLVFEVLKRNPERNIDKIVNTLRNLKFEVVDKYGYEQAQITLGGLNINEINEDFSSKKIKDLYIIGEVLDIDGASGGYNLHFAWMSGIIAANNFS